MWLLSLLEFGAVLLNVENTTVESEFHEYVRPTHRPILSNYCVKLTNITQQLIDRQEPFPIVYKKFLTWLKQIADTKQMHFSSPSNQSFHQNHTTYRADISFCTWTSWDLGHFLRLECERHAVDWPDHLRAWIDVRRFLQVSVQAKFLLSYITNAKNVGAAVSAHAYTRLCAVDASTPNAQRLASCMRVVAKCSLSATNSSALVMLFYWVSKHTHQITADNFKIFIPDLLLQKYGLVPQRCSFAETLQRFNITRTGNEHSAIDDAKTLANMVAYIKHSKSISFKSVTDWRWRH